jgi:branched-chain amino acid aminotransferase
MDDNGFIKHNLTLHGVYSSDEAFFTATPFCMLPVVSVNGRKIGNGKPGPIYNKLLKGWSENVGVDIKAQIQEWDKGKKEGPSAYSFK